MGKTTVFFLGTSFQHVEMAYASSYPPEIQVMLVSAILVGAGVASIIERCLADIVSVLIIICAVSVALPLLVS